jgi:DNA ligase-1
MVLVEAMLKDFKISSFIMDAEIVAIDSSSGAVKTFQELSNRARKDVRIEDVNISVCVFAFDLMLLNEEVSLASLKPAHS